jgi:vacuolar-type H+-ATPase subunit E/Vma4
MEIVRNGELLEAQILEDARTKARRVAEAAEKECDAIRADGEHRMAEEAASFEAARTARVERLRRELASALPLDYRRTRLAFLQAALDKALAAWLAGLSPAEAGRLVASRVSRAASAFTGRAVTVRRVGIDAALARALVEKALPGASVQTVTELTGDEAATAGTGVVVECVDGSRRLRATFGELTAQLLDEQREELITALYGKDVNT